MQLVDNAGPDQPAHLHRLIMAIVACLQNQWTLKYMLTNKECPDQTAQMRSLIWIFAVFIWHKGLFTHIVHHIHHNLFITLLLGSIA